MAASERIEQMGTVENDAAPGRALLNAMPIAAYLCDGDGVVVACNTRARELWGEGLQIGENDQALGGTAPTRTDQGKPAPLEDAGIVIETANGESLDVVASVTRLAQDGSAGELFLKSFRLARPHDDIEDLFWNGVVGLRFVAADGTILRANQAELDLLGYRHDDYVGHNLVDFDADGDNLAKALERILAGESVDKYPARLKGGDGRIRHVQISSSGRFRDGRFLHSLCFTVDVSEQERLSCTMRKRDRASRQLLQALPTAIYTTDIDGRVTFYNEAAVEFAGQRLVLGEDWRASWRLFHPDGTPMAPNDYPLAVALREGRPVHGEEAMAERSDGRRMDFAAYSTPLFDDDGVMTGAVNMLVDIAALRRSELALRELNKQLEHRVRERTQAMEATVTDLHRSERDFALLVGSVVDYAIYRLDPHGVITSWNAGAERIKGYRADEVIGTNFSRFYTPEDRARGTAAHALEIAREEGRYSAEGWRVRKDGSRFWASVVVDPIIDHDTLVGFAKITRDVTERMEAEAALVESEYVARGVIDTALDGFAQLDEDGAIVEWNPQAEKMFGWSRAEALGQSLVALVVAEPDRERFDARLQSAIGHDMPRDSMRPIELVDRDGRAMPVELSVSSLFLNESYRTNVFMRDLSEKTQIESQLRQAQKMEAVGQLTGGLAHDFNNLLQGIIGSLDLIQLRVEEGRTAEVARFVHGALNSANRAAAMTHRLLAFSRRQPLDPRPVLANPLMLSMAELLQRAVGEKITMTFDLANDLGPTLCDPNQLESAVLNLSINARDAMQDGGQLLIRSRHTESDEVVTGNWRDGDKEYICIEVVDNGTGMDEEVIEHAFDPFFTTKPIGQGTGLGLSMVYGFARQSHGYCDIHSKPGEGTTVRLYLPRYLASVEDGQGAAPVEARAATPPGKGETVLVVEDEHVVRHVVVEVLHQLGYTALEAADAEAGLAALDANEDIHLLISDIGLPGMNGRALADASRELRPGLKVLLMTGYAANAAAPEGFVAGMELITKPFTVEGLADRLRKMLGDRRAVGRDPATPSETPRSAERG